MVRESRHLWVGNLPETVREEQIQDYFSRYGRVEKVKLLAKTSPDGGRAAFVDFVDIRSATKANEAQNRMGERDLRTNYNEPGAKNLMDFRGHAVHRIHGTYPSGIGNQPVVIYATAPGDHLIHSQAYRPLYHREEKRVSTYTPLKRDKSPGRSSLSDGSPSVKRSREYSSDYIDSDDNSVRSSSVIIKNLSRNTDSELEEGIYHEFRKAGEITKIKIKGAGADRYAIVKFSKPEEAEKATHSTGRLFQGQTIRVLIRGNKKSRNHSPEKDDLAFDPHATRTVFVGNIEKTMMHGELRSIFERFGDVVDVDIKKMQTGQTTYAFVQYIDINGAMFAKRKMDREYIGHTIVKIGYGRGTPTNCLWIGNLPTNVVDHQLSKIFHPFGYVQHCLIDKRFWQALIRFETIEACTHAFAEMHGKHFQGKRLAVDYASPACRDGFYRRMEEDGQLDRRQLEPSPTPPDAHINFQNVARGGAFQPRGNNYVFKSYAASGDSRSYAEYHPEFSYEKGERDMYGRDKERPRGYSPMSHGSNSPKHLYSPKHTLSRESISPVSSLGFYDRKYRNEERKRKHNYLSSPLHEGYIKKKEKRKKKEKKEKQDKDIEFGYPPVGITSPPLKSLKDAKREKKERKKKDKVRRKSERKQKKILKLQNLQEKLNINESGVDGVLSMPLQNIKAEPNSTANDRLHNKDTEQMKLSEIKQENDVVNASVISSYEQDNNNVLCGTKMVETHSFDKDQIFKTEQCIDKQVIDEIKKTVASPEEGELNEEDGKSSINQLAGSPISQDNTTNNAIKYTTRLQPVDKVLSSVPATNKVKVEVQRSSYNEESSDSSDCTSSDSDSSDSSDDSDNKKLNYKRHSCLREDKKVFDKAREPKAYRQSNRDDFDRREYRAERDREKEYHRSKYSSSDSIRRSPSRSVKSKSPNSSPGCYLKRDNSYDKKNIPSPYSKSPIHSFERKDHYDPHSRRTHTPPPPPPLIDKVKHPSSIVSNGQITYSRENILPPSSTVSQSADTLMDLLRRYPVMWQGLLGLKK